MPVLSRCCASIPEVPLGIVHLGFHFSRVLMRSMEVAGVSTRRTPSLAHVPHSAQPLTLTLATLPPVISRSFAPIPQLPWVSLVHAGFRFGRVVVCFVEVAGVSTRLFPSFCTASHSDGCHFGARAFLELHVYSLTPLVLSSPPEIPFWPRCHVFRGSGRREYKAHPLFLHSLSLSRMPLRRLCFTGVARLLCNSPGSI